MPVILGEVVNLFFSTHRPCVVCDDYPILQRLLESRPAPMPLRKCVTFDGVRLVERPDLPPSVVHECAGSRFRRGLSHFVHEQGGDCSTHFTVCRV